MTKTTAEIMADAQAYIDDQAARGVAVSTTDAVLHVTESFRERPAQSPYAAMDAAIAKVIWDHTGDVPCADWTEMEIYRNIYRAGAASLNKTA